ncbi:MAG: efflux RND transporter periplasmic adaptor subunit [bacterium]|nr:efflux RND transporter periplasmic adaptor subunit [bacterium]
MRRRFYKLAIIFVTAAAMLMLYNCSSQSFSQTGEKKEKDPGTPVEVTKVMKGNITANYSGSATLEAEAEAVVVAKIGEVVQQIFVEEGDMVKEGQALAKLDDEQVKLELSRAESLLKKLSNEFQRNDALHKNKIISKDTYDQVKYDYHTQESTVKLARLNHRYTTIRAPITGVVSERLIKKGNMVQKNQATFRITGFNPLLALLHVPEKEMSKLKKGFPAKLQADALPGKLFDAKIARISPVVDPNTGTFKVTVEVSDKTLALKPGMFARVHIVYDTHKNTLLVPKDSILSEDTESWVFKVDKKKNTAAKTKVVTG